MSNAIWGKYGDALPIFPWTLSLKISKRNPLFLFNLDFIDFRK
jgi:hypothetical protein